MSHCLNTYKIWILFAFSDFATYYLLCDVKCCWFVVIIYYSAVCLNRITYFKEKTISSYKRISMLRLSLWCIWYLHVQTYFSCSMLLRQKHWIKMIQMVVMKMFLIKWIEMFSVFILYKLILFFLFFFFVKYIQILFLVWFFLNFFI